MEHRGKYLHMWSHRSVFDWFALAWPGLYRLKTSLDASNDGSCGIVGAGRFVIGGKGKASKVDAGDSYRRGQNTLEPGSVQPGIGSIHVPLSVLAIGS